MSKDALLEVDPSTSAKVDPDGTSPSEVTSQVTSLSAVTSAASSGDDANFALALAILNASPGLSPPRE